MALQPLPLSLNSIRLSSHRPGSDPPKLSSLQLCSIPSDTYLSVVLICISVITVRSDKGYIFSLTIYKNLQLVKLSRMDKIMHSKWYMLGFSFFI